MALQQQYAVSGRKVRPNYVDIINAQAPYLPAMYRQRDEDEYRQKTLDLEEKSLEQKERELATYEELERAALEEKKKQGRQAKYLGIANLGLKAGMGIYGDKLKDMFEGGSSSPKTADIGSGTSPSGFGGYEGAMFDEAGKSGPLSWTGKATDWSKWGDSLTSWEPWAGGAAGTLAAKVLTDEDDKWYKKAAIGAGAGAIASGIASGGDFYSTALGGLFGAAGGGWFS